MRTLRFTPALLVAGLLACELNAPTDVVPQGPPLFAIANAPAVSGIVIRGEEPFATTWFDPNAGTRVVIGVDPVQFCGGAGFEVVPFQDAILSDGRFVRLLQGRAMTTSVWPFTGFSCALFTTVTPLATGVSDLVYTDNDLFGSVDPNANAWGYLAHGTLTRPSGAAAGFSGHARFRFSLVAGLQVSLNITLN